MTTASLPEDTGGRWCSPIDPTRYERSPALSQAERHAIRELGLRNLRRLRYHDPDAPQWAAISRLLHPLPDVNGLIADVTRFLLGQVTGVVQRCVSDQLAPSGDLRLPGSRRLVESSFRLKGEAVGVALPEDRRHGQTCEHTLEPVALHLSHVLNETEQRHRRR